MAKPKNKVYLVETQPGTFEKFTNWPECQAFVSGKPYAFAGGATEADARAKIERSGKGKGRPASKGKSTPKKDWKDKPKNNVYLVELEPGTYKTFTKWPACQAFIKTNKLPYAGGVTEEEAKAKIERTRDAQLRYKDGKSSRGKSAGPVGAVPTTGICSDAGTHGNPGPCEYQVTDLKGKVLEHKALGVHTNNYAELAGIEAMARYAIAHNETELWTDSKICMGWIDKNRVGESVHEPDALLVMIGSIREMFKANPQLELKKWVTKSWGEIPADFGRK